MRKHRVLAVVSLLCAAANGAEVPIIMSGEYQYRADADSKGIVGDYICFFPDSGSSSLLPRPPGDSRLAWFCFSDTEQAKRVLGLSSRKVQQCGVTGHATVKVTHYKPYRGEGDGFDTADLVSASDIGKFKYLPCK